MNSGHQALRSAKTAREKDLIHVGIAFQVTNQVSDDVLINFCWMDFPSV